MLHIFINNCGLFVIACGLFFIVSSVIGLSRFPDLYSKIHAAGVADSCGIPMTLVGLGMINYHSINVFKLSILIALIYILGPTAAHILLRTVFNSNYQSQSSTDKENIDNNVNNQ